MIDVPPFPPKGQTVEAATAVALAAAEAKREGVDGVLFGSYLELADALVKLCHGHRLVLQGLKFGAAERGKETWRENWRATAAPLFA